MNMIEFFNNVLLSGIILTFLGLIIFRCSSKSLYLLISGYVFVTGLILIGIYYIFYVSVALGVVHV